MSRTDRVVDGITRMILDGELRAGDRLPVEKDLAAALDVSRGSLREGVRALEALGVLEARQGAGTYVTSLDPSLLVGPLGMVVELQAAGHALPVHEVRRTLETEAAGLAARRA
ncbi:FadR/GntR family transcriptional regulator, partial [Cellulomonas carbonis]